MAKTVVVGLSGGVDSSVAAALLLEQGYNVIGLFMHNWEEEQDGECTAAADWQDALAVAETLKIPCYSVNFARQYKERVFAYFLDEYAKGRTPNPDVLCNREIKFGPFKDYAKSLGADFIATGHYCGVGQQDGQPVLLKAKDNDKDQSYFLCQVQTNQLDNVLFPLSEITKPEVRQIAEKYGLANAKKKDSTGICFIGERNFRQFLSTYLPAQSGDIVDTTGARVGRHIGLMYYTLGQRRGLGIGGVSAAQNNRWYVVDKDLTTNTLVVSCGEGEELLSSALITSGFNFIGKPPEIPQNGAENSAKAYECTAKFRYRQGEQAVRVWREGENLRIEFCEKQRAVTPGQFAVLYNGNRCLGGGIIDIVIK